nr:MAG TPA: hypothetical protein [Caudoviricetes sp.]
MLYQRIWKTFISQVISSHIKAIDIIKSQRLVISKLQHQIDRMQDQIDSTQDIKNKLVVMLMKLLGEK